MPAHAASSDSEKSTPSEARPGEIIPHHSHNTEAPALLLHASPSRTNIRRPFWREPLRHTADSPPEADNRFDTGGPCCTEIPGSKVERSERPGISVSVREDGKPIRDNNILSRFIRPAARKIGQRG